MSSGITRKHDPAQVDLQVGNMTGTAYAEGTFIEVEREVDAASKTVGADGEVTLVVSNNTSGTIKATFQQASPMNDYLSGLADALERKDFANAIVPVTMKDNNGTTLASAKQAWVKKKAKTEFDATSKDREWIIETGYLNYNVGGQASVV